MNCQYCKKECLNPNSLRNHERLCKENPDRQIIKSNFIEYNKKMKELGLPGNNQYTKAKKEFVLVIVCFWQGNPIGSSRALGTVPRPSQLRTTRNVIPTANPRPRDCTKRTPGRARQTRALGIAIAVH